jgi:hypothetical protein
MQRNRTWDFGMRGGPFGSMTQIRPAGGLSRWMTIVTVPNRCGPPGCAYLDAAGTFLRGGLACGVRKAPLKAHRIDGRCASAEEHDRRCRAI